MNVEGLSQQHLEPLRAFFDQLLPGEITFIKEDVTDPRTTQSWLDDGRGRRRVALAEEGPLAGSVVGYVAVLPLPGWSSHVGELRLVVHPQHRRSGLGRELTQQALLDAVDLGLRKVVVEVIAAQEGTIEMFRRLGWEGEALLVDHIRDRSGEYRDLLLLAYSVEDHWDSLDVVGVSDSLA